MSKIADKYDYAVVFTPDTEFQGESFFKHLQKLIKEDFYIALHHFSQSILSNNESNGRLNMPLTAVLMTTMDNDAVYGCAGHVSLCVCVMLTTCQHKCKLSDLDDH